jgi:glutaminyl-peptide cyclotransferase
VISRVRGRGPGTIVIGCHYDTKGGIGDEFQGANDSGSGVGVLLELASVFARGPRVQPDILLVFFDGEECVKEYSEWDGLHGSRHLAARMKAGQDRVPVRAVIVVDMVGDRDLTLTVPAGCSPRLVSMLFAAAREESVRERVSLAAGGILDDHAPFLEAGMPAIDLIDFQYGSQPGRNDYWHTPEDRMDRLSPQSLQTVGRMILRMVNGLL